MTIRRKIFLLAGTLLALFGIVVGANSYFGAVAAVIHAHHGVIDKYIGDAVMAF
jgi:class 3 adenylate cyclase